MRPAVQVWTPFFWKGPFDDAHARDLRRAQREWRREERVWLDPDAPEVTRWTRDDQGMVLRECVVPSETINCLAVSHVDSKGRVFPFLPLPEQWGGTVSGAYGRWLLESVGFSLVQSDKIRMPKPVVKDGKVSFVETVVTVSPKASVPISNVTEDGVFDVAWRNAGNAEMLALDQEVGKDRGPARYERQVIDGKEWLLTVSGKDSSSRGVSLELGWTEPFSYMFGRGAGAELLSHQAKIDRCVRQLQDGRGEQVMKEAETWVDVLTSPGRAPTWHSWFAPMAMANEEEALFAVETQYDLPADSMKELYESKRFGGIMNQWVEVVVANDWLGYLWWDFYQDLREKVTIRFCEACGRAIRGGHRDRRFCSREENLECFRKRNTTSQRKKRGCRS